MIFGSTILDVAFGLFFVYLVLSLLCSTIGEYIEAKFNHRAKYLRQESTCFSTRPREEESILRSDGMTTVSCGRSVSSSDAVTMRNFDSRRYLFSKLGCIAVK